MSLCQIIVNDSAVSARCFLRACHHNLLYALLQTSRDHRAHQAAFCELSALIVNWVLLLNAHSTYCLVFYPLFCEMISDLPGQQCDRPHPSAVHVCFYVCCCADCTWKLVLVVSKMTSFIVSTRTIAASCMLLSSQLIFRTVFLIFMQGIVVFTLHIDWYGFWL